MKAANNKPKYDLVLLIDDDGIDNFINERIITSSNFARQVVVKTNVKEAIEYISKTRADKAPMPNIIFLDLNMPVAGGFEFMKEYEKIFDNNESDMRVSKVIVLSSSVSPEDINRVSLIPWVYKYLNKPLNETYLSAINF